MTTHIVATAGKGYSLTFTPDSPSPWGWSAAGVSERNHGRVRDALASVRRYSDDAISLGAHAKTCRVAAAHLGLTLLSAAEEPQRSTIARAEVELLHEAARLQRLIDEG